jgi:ankyrin repeat protein
LDQDALTDALRFACVSGNVDVVRLLIQLGGNPNSYDEQLNSCPLSNAIRQGHAEIVELLLEAGADATRAVSEEDGVGDLTGRVMTYVDLAVQQGYPAIAKLVG